MQTVIAILQLIPALIAAIKAIEEAIPGQGKGEAKLAAVREIIEATYEGVSKMWPAIEKTIAILVAMLNKNGWTGKE